MNSKQLHKKKTLKTKIFEQRYLLLLLLPALLVTLIFKYFPMYGILMAFKNYNPRLGIFGSEWVGFKHFEDFIYSPNFNRLLLNTLKLSVYGFLWGYFPPIILALMFNQIVSERVKKLIQLVMYTPNFISTVIIVGMIFLFFAAGGPLASILNMLNISVPAFLTDAEWFRPLYIFSGIWQGMGWASVLYTSALASVPTELYEAAEMDGATIWDKIINIDVPTMKPLMIVNLVLAIGNIMNVGYEKAFLMQTSLNLPASEIIATYVYKVGLQSGNYSYSTAIGLFNSLINLVLILTATFIVTRYNRKVLV